MHKKYFIILFCFINSILLANLPEPSGRRLRVIVADKYSDSSIIIGATTGSWAFGTNTGLIMDREFSYVTPENDFKQLYIHPDLTTWNWTQSDKWIQHIVDNNQVLRMHCPIGPQCSIWAKNDTRTVEELETNLREFFKAVCERYNGKTGIEYMDVVNETVTQGYWHTDKPGTDWECPWYKIGQDNDTNKTPLYIKIAFEIAQQYVPDIKFIYNHNEDDGASWELIIETIEYLRAKGLRVDGIGWQAHVDNGWATTENLNGLRNLIDWAHNNNLEFHITEASVWLNGNSQTLLEEQAATYRAIIEVLLENRSTGKVGWNTWHIDDAHGWHTELYPSLFDTNYAAKPAYYAIQEALEIAMVEEIEGSKFEIQSLEAYPNPFITKTVIEFRIKGNVGVQYIEPLLQIYDLAGRLVKSFPIHDSQFTIHKVTWNGKNNLGESVSSGVYFYKLKVGDEFSQIKKLLLLSSRRIAR